MSSDTHHHDTEKHGEKDSGIITDVTDVQPDSVSISSLEAMAKAEGIKPEFLAKCQVLNAALADCGMGAYQWKLFMSAGFGWFADNIWLQSVAILMPAVANQDGWPTYPDVRLATLAMYAGLIAGSLFWGMTCDVIGRRLAWNLTLIIGGIFGVAAGAAPNFATFGTMLALLGFGVGGNMPVDGTLFLEFLPGSHQYLLTLLSVWWAIGQVVGSLVCWVFLDRYSCDSTLVGTAGYICDNSNNQGWRYSYYTLGAMMLFLSALRVFFLPMEESPKFLVSLGRDAEAVAVVHRIAKTNGTVVSFTVEELRAAGLPFHDGDESDESANMFSTWELVKNSFHHVDGEHVKSLFSTARLAYSTSLIIFIYGALGLAYPLFNAFLGSFLATRLAATGNTSINATYSAYTYQAACGVIGSFLAAALVQWSRGGRKFAMAFFTIVSGVFLFGLTAATTAVQVNVLTCMASLFENAFYGVLYGYAPEVFATPHRGTGDALASASSRITGIFAPIIAVYSAAGQTANGPVYASGAIFIVTGLSMLGLPIETVGITAH